MRRSLRISLISTVVIALLAIGGTIAAGNSPQLGLDLQGGASVVLRPKNDVDSAVLDQSIEIIRNRVDALGVAEPDIVRQGDNIVVQLPGVRDQDRALEIVGQTAELRFRPVITILPPLGQGVSTETTTTTAPAGEDPEGVPLEGTPEDTSVEPEGGEGSPSTSVVSGEGRTAQAEETTTTTAPTEEGATSTTAPPEDGATSTTATTVPPNTDDIPNTLPEEDVPEATVILPSRGDPDGPRYQLAPACLNIPSEGQPCDALTGRIVKTASAFFDQASNGWAVRVNFTGEGSSKFDQLAAANVGRQVAITLDGGVISAPTIQEAQFGGEAVISGDFGEGEAKDLAVVLRYGSLPVQLEPEAVQQVSASLGEDSLRAGIVAGLIGAGLVLLYMVFYYRALGVVVAVGLTVWGSLLWSVISYLGEAQGLALTLAGATGIIISIGVTVDSYVVYFERLKDEVRSGRTVRSSVDRAFSRAFRTILAADVSSFIGASLLYWLTVGPVRGFAFFLGLSTILDVIIAWFFTRPLVGLLARNRVFTEARWLGVARGLGARTAESPA